MKPALAAKHSAGFVPVRTNTPTMTVYTNDLSASLSANGAEIVEVRVTAQPGNDTEPETFSYRGFIIEPRQVSNRAVRYVRFVVLDATGQPVGPRDRDGNLTHVAALTERGARDAVDGLIRKAELEAELERRTIAANSGPGVTVISSKLRAARKLGRREIGETLV